MTRAASRRGWWLAASLLLLFASAVALYNVSRARCFVLVGDVTCRVETDERVVALSFDDGPTPLGVDALLPVLNRAGVRATFFLVGESAAERPDLVRRLLAGGHEVGNHSWSHRRMLGLFPGPYRDEIARTDAVLRRVGASPTLFRPPYGKKLTGLPLALRKAGYRMVTADMEEPTTTDPRAYAAEIVGKVRPGSIVGMHVMFGANATARAALPLVLDGLRKKGYRVLTVGELIARDGAVAG